MLVRSGDREERDEPFHSHLPVVIVRKRSWPAVSQIWSFIRFPSTSIVFTLKSILHSSRPYHNHNQGRNKSVTNRLLALPFALQLSSYPIVVMKDVVNESSE